MGKMLYTNEMDDKDDDNPQKPIYTLWFIYREREIVLLED